MPYPDHQPISPHSLKTSSACSLSASTCSCDTPIGLIYSINPAMIVLLVPIVGAMTTGACGWCSAAVCGWVCEAKLLLCAQLAVRAAAGWLVACACAAAASRTSQLASTPADFSHFDMIHLVIQHSLPFTCITSVIKVALHMLCRLLPLRHDPPGRLCVGAVSLLDGRL